MAMQEDGAGENQTRARFFRAFIVLLPFYAAIATDTLWWAGDGPEDPTLFTGHFFTNLRLMAHVFPIWLGLLIVPQSIKEAGLLTVGLVAYLAAVAGLGVLASIFGLNGLPIFCAAFLTLPLIVAAYPRIGVKGWVERLAESLRRGLLRGLAGLGAGLIVLLVLWAAVWLFREVLQDRLPSLWGYAAALIGVGATLALLLAWEEWAEPLVRRFWALLLPILLVLGVVLAAAILFVGSQQVDGLLTVAITLPVIAASLLFAAGTRKDPGIFTKISRLTALPLVLLSAWLLWRAFPIHEWGPGYLHVCLILTGVFLASLRAWIVQLLPRLWLPEGLVTLLLPLIALIGIIQTPFGKTLEPKPAEIAAAPVSPAEVELVWPLGQQVPEDVRIYVDRESCKTAVFCRVMLLDLNGDGDPELIDLTSRSIMKKAGGTWRKIGTLSGRYGSQGDISAVESASPTWRDVMINGKRVEVTVWD